MQIIHEVDGEFSCVLSVDRYRSANGKPPIVDDGRAEVSMFFKSLIAGIPDEAVYLRGSAKNLIYALRETADLLECEIQRIASQPPC